MGRMNLRRIFIGLCGWLLMTGIQAGMPLWTFIPLMNTHLSIAPTQTATVQYLVTNQSKKFYLLTMLPIVGVNQITAGAENCSSPFILGYHQSCILTLQVNGSALIDDVLRGPVVCQQGNSLQCEQPDLVNSLAIRLIQLPTLPPPATLVSLTITPDLASTGIGETMQYRALGKFSDGSTQNLTTSVTWASSKTSIVTTNSTGLATGISNGTITINASLGSVSSNYATLAIHQVHAYIVNHGNNSSFNLPSQA